MTLRYPLTPFMTETLAVSCAVISSCRYCALAIGMQSAECLLKHHRLSVVPLKWNIVEYHIQTTLVPCNRLSRSESGLKELSRSFMRCRRCHKIGLVPFHVFQPLQEIGVIPGGKIQRHVVEACRVR